MSDEGAVLSNRVRDLLLGLKPTQAARDALEIYSDREAPPSAFARVLEANPAALDRLLKLESVRKHEEWSGIGPGAEEGEDEEDAEGGRPHRVVSSTQRALQVSALLGRSGARNALLCLEVERAGGPSRAGRSALDARAQLRRAIIAEELCEEHRLADPDMAFIGGFHYDWLAAWLQYSKGGAPILVKYLDQVWEQSLLTARIAYALATVPSQLKWKRYAFSAALCIGIGKVMMSLNGGPPWDKFAQEWESPGDADMVAEGVVEARTFSATHAELAALFAVFFGFLAPVERAILRYREPFRLNGVDAELFRLALILSVADTTRRLAPEPATLKSLPISRGQQSLLGAAGLHERDLIPAIRRVAKR